MWLLPQATSTIFTSSMTWVKPSFVFSTNTATWRGRTSQSKASLLEVTKYCPSVLCPSWPCSGRPNEYRRLFSSINTLNSAPHAVFKIFLLVGWTIYFGGKEQRTTEFNTRVITWGSWWITGLVKGKNSSHALDQLTSWLVHVPWTYCISQFMKTSSVPTYLWSYSTVILYIYLHVQA